MTASDTSAATDTRNSGILLFVAAVFLLSIMDVLVKIAAERFPVGQIVFFRSAIALVLIAVVLIARREGRRALRARRPGLLVLRGLVSVVTAASFFTALGLMPLIDAYAIAFSAPLIITALSAAILRERVDLRRWLAVLVGFLGVVVVLRPGVAGMEAFVGLGALAALGGAFGYAVAMILTRIAGRTDSAATIVVYGMGVMTLGSALSLPFAYVPPTLPELALLAMIGLVGGVAHLSMALAYRRAEASLLAPFEYISVIWGLGFGWLIWRDLPDAWVILGCSIIVASGLYILQRETWRRSGVSAPFQGNRLGAVNPASDDTGRKDRKRL